MKRITCTLIVMLFTIYSFGQINFERGYFINNKDVKIDCLIKNEDWKNNPTEFSYKLSEAGEAKKADIASVKEFGIYQKAKYIRAKVNVDYSSDLVEDLSKEQNPLWVEKTLFLKTLFEGVASLYYYEETNVNRFFYSVSDSAITQLVYKRYVTKKGEILSNNSFRQQLWENVNPTSLNPDFFNKIYYEKKYLLKYFRDNGGVSDNSYVESAKGEKRDAYKFDINGGLCYSSLGISNPSSDKKVNFDNSFNYIVGISAEYFLPFSRNKWSLIFKPNYQYFKSEGAIGSDRVEINYGFVEFPMGCGYKMYLNDELTISLKGFFIPNYYWNKNDKIYIHDSNNLELDISSSSSYAFSAGIDYKRWSLDLMYYSTRGILGQYVNWRSEYKRICVVLGFNLF